MGTYTEPEAKVVISHGLSESISEDWEIIRLIRREIPRRDEDLADMKILDYDYILLKKTRRVTLYPVPINTHSLSIEIQPISNVRFEYEQRGDKTEPIGKVDYTIEQGIGYSCWTASACLRERQVQLVDQKFLQTPDRYQDRGLGCYLFSQLIAWGQQYHPDFAVKDLSLSHYQAEDPEAKELRNNFYQKFGFELEFSDSEEKSGTASAPTMASLKQYWNPAKIERVSLEGFMRDLSDRTQELRKQKNWLESNANQIIVENRVALVEQIQFWRAIALAAAAVAAVTSFRFISAIQFGIDLH